MTPTIFQFKNYRFLFFSREEPRLHVHVRSPDGEAKFWLDPEIELAVCYGFSEKEIRELKNIVEEKKDEIRKHWDKHFQT